MNRFVRDLRIASRALLRRPTLTITALAMLALGIGMTTSVFSLLRSIVFRPLPFAEPDRLVMIWESAPHRGRVRNVVNSGNYMRWKERATSFAGMSAEVAWRVNVGDGESAERVLAGLVASDFFDTLGVRVARGRPFGNADGVEGAARVAVLAWGYWHDRFAGDPEIIGRELSLDGDTVTVVGVAPPGLDYPLGVRLWSPIRFGPAHREAKGRYLEVVARLAPGVTLDAARGEMASLASELERERPEINPMWTTHITTLDEEIRGALRRPFWMLLAAAGTVLLIACANLSGLLIARNREREGELALRAALGADRAALARPLFAEVALLSLVGGLLGVLAARAGLDLLTRWLPIDLPAFSSPALDLPVLGGSLVATSLSALLVGLATVARAARLGIRASLHGSESRTTGDPGAWMRSALVVCQAALSLVLVAGALLFGRSLSRLLAVDSGFDVDRVVTGQVAPTGVAYDKPAKLRSYFARVEERLRGRPQVLAAGWSTWPVLAGPGSATDFWAGDRPAPDRGKRKVADIRGVTPGFFRAAGTRLVAGRLFSDSDGEDAPPVAVLDERAARELWPGEEPLGKRVFLWWGEDLPAEVVGIVADVRLNALDSESRGAVFRPLDQLPNSFATLFVRSRATSAAAASAIRETLSEIDGTVPIADLQTLEQVVARGTQRPRFLAGLTGLFTFEAITLTAIGLYGLVAGATIARRRELGVRLALGAARHQIFTGVVTRGLRLVALGIGIGLPLAFGATRLLRSLVFEISPYDPWAFVATIVIVAVVGTVACLLPAGRASRMDPARVLRDE